MSALRAKIVVGELRALGLAGGARRVEDHRGVAALALDDLGAGSPALQHGLEVPGLDQQAVGMRPVAAGVRRVGQLVPGEQQPRLGVGQVVLDLTLLEEHVHRHDHAAAAQDAVVDRCEVRHVRKHHSDAVARAHALGLEQTGDAARGLLQAAVGQRQVVELDRVPVRRARGGVGQQLCEVRHLSLPGPEMDVVATSRTLSGRAPCGIGRGRQTSGALLVARATCAAAFRAM